MPFLTDDEYIILMDSPNVRGRMFTDDELASFRDCGIRTAIWCDTRWDNWLADDFKTYHWEYFDDYLARLRKASIKAIIPLWHRQSDHYPDRYYIVSTHLHRGLFSPWNPDAQELVNRSYTMIRDRYSADDCLIISAQCQGGERVLLNRPSLNDSFAQKSWAAWQKKRGDNQEEWVKDTYIRLLLEQQRILTAGEHKEIWYMLSRHKAFVPYATGHGCAWIDDYLRAWKKLKPAGFYHISFNFFPYLPAEQKFFDAIQKEQVQFKVQEIVGAEYCEGLRDGNGKKAVELGMRGLILHPCHPFTKHERVEPWMYDEIRKTMKLFVERGAVVL